jgi:Fe-S-cluster-containing dehydrogenase component/DMSO reductase anchor subunit
VSAAPPAFVHDLATCVGCHACVVACAVENGTAPGAFWRQVVTHNEERHPQLPVFHLSLACNHCLDAPCERHCPALALSRDARTGAVLLDGDRCVGCRYCAWVCPYDAPRFDDARGVMGKCTLCHHRILEGRAPACTAACPTGALALGERGEDAPRGVPGFADAGIRPTIRFLPPRGRAPAREAVEQAAAAGAAALGPWPAPPPKTSLRTEWSLLAFTSVVIGLAAWALAATLGGPALRPIPFLALGAAALLLSARHLGRPERALRALANVRRSWLSREVAAVPAFLALGVAHAALAPAGSAGGLVVAAAGGLALVCADRVYAVMARERRSPLDDVAGLSSAAFLAGVLSAQPWLALPAAAVRLLAFAGRIRGGAGTWGAAASTLVLVRVLVGLVLPVTAVLASPAVALPLAVVAAFAGELLDRAHFYAALDVTTPRRRMARDVEAARTAAGAGRA